MPDIVTIGEGLCEFLSGETGVQLSRAITFEKGVAGAAAGVAAALARLGIDSGIVTRVGDDPFGHFLADTLASEGVDVSELGFERRARTGLVFVSLNAGGERVSVLFRHPSADMLLSPGHIKPGYIQQARLIVYESTSFMGEPSRSATLKALAIGRNAGILCAFDLNLRLALWGSQTEASYGVRLGLDRADVVKLSLREMEFLSGIQDPASGTQSLWAEGMRLMVVTMGSQGCAYRTAAGFGQIPGQQVEVVDKGGAGEGFMAGLLAEWVRRDFSLDKSDIERALSFANAVAALTTSQRGTLRAFPTAEQVSSPHLSG
jgi:sugar/nucleoside kinase (ribokinase family)